MAGKVYTYEEGLFMRPTYNDNGSMYYGDEAKRKAVERGGPGLVDGVTGEKGMASPPGGAGDGDLKDLVGKGAR